MTNAPIPTRTIPPPPKVHDHFVRRLPSDKEWSTVDNPDDDPIVAAMNAVGTNYLQYTVGGTNHDVGKRGQVRYFREKVYEDGSG